MSSKYQKSDYRSLELHRLAASKIKEKPELINKAIENIERWKSQNSFAQPYLDEWMAHINEGIQSLIKFMESESDVAARLRSSSPFVGIIKPEERTKIFKEFHE